MLFYIKILILVKVFKNRLLVLGLFLKTFILYIIEEKNSKKQREALLHLSSIIILKYFEKKVNNCLTYERKYAIIKVT